MNITQDTTPNQGSREGWKPDVIVFHIADGTYGGTISWLKNPKSQVSAHFVLGKEGQVTQLVPLDRMAWCNGTSLKQGDSRYYGKAASGLVKIRTTNANYYTVSIECEGFYRETHGTLSDAQLTGAVQLVQWIRAELKRIYGVEIPLDRQHIIGHDEVTPITKPNCPGEQFPFEEILRRAGDLRYTLSFTDISTVEECEALAKFVGEMGYTNHEILPQTDTGRYTVAFTDISTLEECKKIAELVGQKGYTNHTVQKQS